MQALDRSARPRCSAAHCIASHGSATKGAGIYIKRVFNEKDETPLIDEVELSKVGKLRLGRESPESWSTTACDMSRTGPAS